MRRIAIALSVVFAASSVAADKDQQSGAHKGAERQSGQAELARAVVSRSMASCLKHLKEYPEQSRRSSDKWGPFLTDVARRLPAGAVYQDAYRRYTEANDLVTAGHEWTHFLNGYLSGKGTSAFYVLGGKYMTLTDPEGLRGIVPHVPSSLRGELYDLYLVQNRGNARVDPLYLFDEWTAYANDVTIAVDQLAQGKPLNPFNPQATQPHTAANALEFTFYGCAVGMAVKKYDPEYYASQSGQKLREFIALNTVRSLEVYRKALKRDELSEDDDRNAWLLKNFRNSSDAAEMRDWVRLDLGKDVANELLAIEGSVDTGAARQPRVNGAF